MKTFSIRAIIVALLFTTFNKTIEAQQEQVLGLTTELWQSNLTNPALLPEKKINISLGGGFVNFKSDFAIKDFVKVNPESGREQIIDTLVLGKLTNSNKGAVNFNVMTLGLSIPLSSNLRLSVHHAYVGDGALDLSGDLARAFSKGNVQFLGKTVSLGSSLDYSFRSQIGVGLAYTFSALTVGARINYLAGSQAVFTPKKKLDVSFSSDAQNLSVNSDFAVYTFGFSDNAPSLWGITSGNTGYSFDVGAAFKLGKLQLAASILDIGGTINWKNDPRAYASTSNATYSGENVEGFFKYTNYDGKTYVDSLKKYFNYSDVRAGTYKQTLPLRIYVSGSYELTEKWRLGALLSADNGGTVLNNNTGVIVDVTRKFGSVLILGASTGIKNGQFSTLGMHGTLKLGPVQLYGLTDNIVALVRYTNAKTASARIGLNLIF